MSKHFDKLLACLRALKEQRETSVSVRAKSREELQIEVGLSSTDYENSINLIEDNELWEAVLQAFEIMERN